MQNLQTAEAALKQRLAAMQNALSEALAQAAVPGQPAVLHCDGADGDGLRRICLAVSARTNALTAVLASGGQGLAYALCLPGGAAASPAFARAALPALILPMSRIF